MDADYGMTELAYDAERGRQFTQDANLIVNFVTKPHPDKEASLREGRPMFKPKEYVTIMVPGDKNTTVNRPAWDQDRQRFPRQYAAFKNNEDQNIGGTPMSTVAWVTREQVEELKFFNIRTLEQLANCPDVHAQKFMGINSMRQRARDQIQAAKELQPLAALRAEVETRESQLKTQNELIQRLEARLKVLEDDADED